ncbi:hypothetical protein, partial [Sphingobium yanoikuyae]|uniref:hypothetical protein n=1 Tax=Sphingobium yanoikuyae TaxID=13690 RepID=UPI002447F865
SSPFAGSFGFPGSGHSTGNKRSIWQRKKRTVGRRPLAEAHAGYTDAGETDSSGSFNYDKVHYHPVLVASIP